LVRVTVLSHKKKVKKRSCGEEVIGPSLG
jgi:hypothetical protein